jgi:beta-lactamase superfamily II metal-dependent hydrolase
MADSIRFAGYPQALVYESPDGEKAVQQLIWGDWLRLEGGEQGDYLQVHARGVDGWMHRDSIQSERLLEIVFVDIGQGDGALLVTPEDRCMVIDAGVGDNMYRFLRWRFGSFRRPFRFESAVISHPDSDHYGGFEELFDEPNVSFGTVYHNGIVERAGKDRLGPKTTSGRPRYLTDVIRSRADLETLLADEANWERKKYPTLLHKGLSGGRIDDICMLSAADGTMPGYGPDGSLVIEVLGPVMEDDRLRWLGSTAKTKNGHSVVLKVRYHNVCILLGGDLNIPAEELLLGHHTGLPAPPESLEETSLLIEAARRVFQVDVAKSCHHGSADFSPLFMEALNPLATVISSGDDEPYSHPRSDTLGAIGRHSRGARPLIFSTELARSAPEAIKQPYALRRQLKELARQIDEHPTDTASDRRKKQRLQKKYDKLVDSLDRSVAVYGAINLRTDGEKILFAQKLERPRSVKKKWDLYQIEPQGEGGPLRYVSKH